MLDQISFEHENTPEEVQKTLIQFLGQTYQELAQFDNNIVSPNQFLAPKKHEFQRTAEKVMQEALGAISSHNRVEQRMHVPQEHPRIVQRTEPAKPYLDGGNIVPPPPNDPNQMEFSFDNSVTAITINIKLDNIEKKMKKIDKMLSEMLSLMDKNESKDIKQK